jgi:hypothetical protein
MYASKKPHVSTHQGLIGNITVGVYQFDANLDTLITEPSKKTKTIVV